MWGPAAEPAPDGHDAVAENDALLEGTASVGQAQDPVADDSLHEFEETEKAVLSGVELPVEEVSFLSKEGDAITLNRPAWRWGLGILSLLLTLGLLSQAAYRERHSLAAWEPRLAPWLVRACNVIGCSGGPRSED